LPTHIHQIQAKRGAEIEVEPNERQRNHVGNSCKTNQTNHLIKEYIIKVFVGQARILCLDSL
jgi:hypothetical protein